MKRDLSFQTQEEIKSINKKTINEKINTQIDSNYSSLSTSLTPFSPIVIDFLNHLPSWGGKVELDSSHIFYETYKKFSLSNTCSIDYLLLCIWFIYKIKSNVFDLLFATDIDKTFLDKVSQLVHSINEHRWNLAKSIWIIDICNLRPSRRVFNCEDNEYDKIVKYFNLTQTVNFFCCNKTCALNEITVKTEDQLYFRKDMNNNVCLTFIDKHNCTNFLLKRLVHTTPWLFMSSLKKNDFMCFDELPQEITIHNLKFTIVCATIVSTTVIKHFCAIFKIDSRKFLIDDLNSSYSEDIPNVHNVSTCLYHLFIP